MAVPLSKTKPQAQLDDYHDTLSWYVTLLPYVDRQDLYARFDLAGAWNDQTNLALSQNQIRMLRCPDLEREFPRSDAWVTPYIGIAGVGSGDREPPASRSQWGVFAPGPRTALDEITDGTSTTMLVLESAHKNGPWAQGGFATVRWLDPADQPLLGTGRPFGGTHFSENGFFYRGKSICCQALLADGSTRSFSENTSSAVLAALATIAGGAPKSSTGE